LELGSHAQLIGDISVQSGGTFIIREGVQQRYEFVEGGYMTENIYKYRDFCGLKGDIATESDASLQFSYSEENSSANVYSGNITGAGNVEVGLGIHGGALVLESAGNNSTIRFASSTIRANVSANIRNATLATEKAKSEAARSLLKIQGAANYMATVNGTDIDLAAATNL